ncbi:MAG: mevalonate kinase, partial [Candidatus Aenigmatarchaeota archaeon]
MPSYSVPGKVHLIGEHAVVYGEPAMIAAVGRRCVVSAEKSDKIEIYSADFGSRTYEISEAVDFAKDVQALWKDGLAKKDFSPLFQLMRADKWNFRKAAIGIVLRELGIDGGVSISIKSDIPIGSGLGSSSALSVGLVAAIQAAYGKQLVREQINDLAYKLECINHGTPSGGDNSACCFGGLVWFQKAQPKNIIMPLNEEIPHSIDGFVLLWTGMPERTTGELVQAVRNLDENYRKPRMKEIGQLCYEMKTVLKARNYARMKEIINRNQQLLAELGVSTPTIDRIAEVVRGIGGAAKLCGAGGGGTML